MSNINLNLYKIFCAVAQSKNYSEASEKLLLSPSNISTQITNLENLLDTQLFYREKSGMRLTEAGEELFEIVNSGIESFDLAEKILKKKNDLSKAKITIGCPSHLAIFYLMECIEKAKKDYPGLKIRLVSGANSGEMIQLLQNHEVDFVIIDVVPTDSNGIKVKELKNINNIFISKNALKINDLKELEDFKYILNFKNTITTQKLMEVLKQHDIKIEANMECDITELRIDAVKRNLGVGYVMKEAVKRELENKEIYEVEIPIELPSLKINLIYEQLSKVDKSFINKYLQSEL